MRKRCRSCKVTVLLVLSFVLASNSNCLGTSCGETGDWRDIYILPTNGNAATNIRITLDTDKSDVVPGDQIIISFKADRECYLTLMAVGTSGKVIRLWPNSHTESDNRIAANELRQFPRSSDNFRYRISGPKGTERIVAYATSEKGKILSEDEFRKLGGTFFSEFRGTTKDLALVFAANSDSASRELKWGTSQKNICISEPAPSAAPPLKPQPTSQAAPPATPDSSPKILYCLAVGVSLGDLKNCEQDARKFVDATKKRLGLKDHNLRLVLGREATVDGFVEGMKWLSARTRPEDEVIIYYNGHGSQVPDQPPLDEVDCVDEVFVLYHRDAKRLTVAEALKRKLVMTDDEFNVLMKKIPARKKLLIADACHSATLNKAVSQDQDDLVSKYYRFADPTTGEEIVSTRPKAVPTNYGNDNEAIMSACLDNESSYESQALQGSVFTHFLIAAINAKSPNLRDAFLSAREKTIRYCQKETQKDRHGAASQTKQTPHLTDPHGFVKLFTSLR